MSRQKLGANFRLYPISLRKPELRSERDTIIQTCIIRNVQITFILHGGCLINTLHELKIEMKYELAYNKPFHRVLHLTRSTRCFSIFYNYCLSGIVKV